MKAAKRYTNSEAVSEAKKRVTKWKAKHSASQVTPRRASGFLKFCRKMACEYEDVPEALDRSDFLYIGSEYNKIRFVNFNL